MRDLQPDITEQLIETAEAAGVISAAHFPRMPAALPMHAAIRAIALPAGCAPPAGGLGRRIASGTGETQAAAAWTAGMEALERYSLQFSPARAAPIRPFATIGGAAEMVEGGRLLLGAPPPFPAASTRGSAAGRTLSDAARRAALEMLEHIHIGRARAGEEQLRPVHDIIPAALSDFLASQLRRLDLAAHVSSLGYAVVHATMCDLDGGRMTTGSAAAADLDEAARKAWQEAMLSWRNMIEMERNAVSATALSGEEAEAFRLYRGAATHPGLHVLAGNPVTAAGTAPGDLLAILSQVTNARVRAFDLTEPGIGLPVVRILIG